MYFDYRLCQLTQGTAEAAKNLDVVLSGLRENSAEGTDYFQVLTDVFSNVRSQHYCKLNIVCI